jgi:primosomal protein N' (replication factor Y)
VVGLPVSGPFDYIVPAEIAKKIQIGSRVWVDFRGRRIGGYVVAISRQSNIKKLKTLSELIDALPLLDKNMLLLTKEVSDYYCSTWGEVIETALPEALRKGKPITIAEGIKIKQDKCKTDYLLVHDLDGQARWDVYIERIKEVLSLNKSVILLSPDINSIKKAKNIIDEKIGCFSGISYRKQPQELNEWVKIKQGKAKLVVGTRSAIFAPLGNLGLIIIDEEEDSVFKQDQVPHYNAREVAFMRARIERAKLILGSVSPSLETFYLHKKNRIKYLNLQRKKVFPEIKIIDTRHLPYQEKRQRLVFSRFLTDSIYSVLGLEGKVLLFLNRRGFATHATCHNCGISLKCPRCNINLVYHFEANILNCHYCNFKMETPKICPHCNSGYIKFSGVGTEKIESELSRIFPQAKITRLDTNKNVEINDADIFVSTSSIFKRHNLNFDLIGVLSVDNSLNRIDFRASEKTFALLAGLLGLTNKQIIIQTSFPQHHCFKAITEKDTSFFYEKELKERFQLKFPPYKHIILVKLRGKNADSAKRLSQLLFERLKGSSNNKSIKIVSLNPCQPSKLRGNFYWQVLIIGGNIKKIVDFLKIKLKVFAHSGIIITVDVDPV